MEWVLRAHGAAGDVVEVDTEMQRGLEKGWWQSGKGIVTRTYITRFRRGGWRGVHMHGKVVRMLADIPQRGETREARQVRAFVGVLVENWALGFTEDIGPVRSVFCKAETPPNRSPPPFDAWVDI